MPSHALHNFFRKDFACFAAFSVDFSVQLYAEFIGFCKLFLCERLIAFRKFNALLHSFEVCLSIENNIFKFVLIVVVFALQSSQTGHFRIKLYLLFYARISGCQSLHFGVIEYHIVHVLARSCGSFSGHKLRNKFLLCHDYVHHVRVKGVLRDVVEYADLAELVALSDYSTVALLQIRGLPGDIKIMQCSKPSLYVRACAELRCGRKHNAFLSGAELREHLVALVLVFRVTGCTDFVSRDTSALEFLLDVVVNGEFAVRGIDGDVAEDSLNAFLLLCVLVNLHYLVDTEIYLAVRGVLSFRIYRTRVQTEQARFVSYLEHIVHGGVYRAAVNVLRALCKYLHIRFLEVVRLCNDSLRLAALQLRHIEL